MSEPLTEPRQAPHGAPGALSGPVLSESARDAAEDAYVTTMRALLPDWEPSAEELAAVSAAVKATLAAPFDLPAAVKAGTDWYIGCLYGPDVDRADVRGDLVGMYVEGILGAALPHLLFGAPADPSDVRWLDLAKANQRNLVTYRKLAEDFWERGDVIAALRNKGIAEGLEMAQINQLAASQGGDST